MRTAPGEVRVFSGLDGSELLTVFGAAHESIGYRVASIEDLDGDGVRDLVSTRFSKGMLDVWSGATGGEHRLDGHSPREQLSYAACAAPAMRTPTGSRTSSWAPPPGRTCGRP